MKMHLVKAELFHVVGQTDMKLAATFYTFTNIPKH